MNRRVVLRLSILCLLVLHASKGVVLTAGVSVGTTSAVGPASSGTVLHEEYFEEEEFLEDDSADLDAAAEQRSLHVPKKRLPLGGKGAVFPPIVAPVVLEPQRIIKEYSCPQGMTLIGRECVGRHVLAPTRFCPPYARLVGTECISKLRPIVSCPPGLFLRAGRCIASDLFAADLTCPGIDEEIDPHRGCCTRAVPSPPKCPPGFLLLPDGATCQQVLPAAFDCPAGYDLSPTTLQCLRSVRVPATVICPDGAILDPATHRCTITRQDPPRCPRRFTFHPDFQRCAQPVNEVPAPCPPGYTSTPHGCERAETLPAEPYCFEGYSLEGISCVREIAVPASCPAGFQFARTGSHICEKIVPEIPVCPEGTETKRIGSGIQCERVVYHDLTQCCLPGFELVGDRCERMETLPAKLSCDRECYQVRTSPIAFACPEGTRFVDDPAAPKCVRDVLTNSCSRPSLPPRCASDAALRATEGNRHLAVAPECMREPESICSQVPRTEVILAQAYCPDGGEVEGDLCVFKEPIIPEKICEVGALDPVTDQCVRTVTAPPKNECPPGTIQQGPRCMSRELVPPNFICPDSTEEGPNNCCVSRAAVLQHPSSVETVAASWRCLRGRLGPDGRSCLEVSRTPLEMMCPPGSERGLSGGCFMTAEMIIPAAVQKFVRPSYLCPEGRLDRTGATCVITEALSALPVCRLDTAELDGEKCYNRVPAIVPPPRIISSVPIPVCPPNSIARGTTCLITREAEPLISCAEGYTYNENACIQSTPLHSVCPPGTVEAEDGCVREVIVPPLIRIVQGCVHNITPSCVGCPRIVSSNCHRL